MSTTEERAQRRWLRLFGAAIRALRTQAGLSQEALGFRSHLDRTYVSGIERGVRNPTLTTLLRLGTALGKTPSQILRLAEEKVRQKEE